MRRFFLELGRGAVFFIVPILCGCAFEASSSGTPSVTSIPDLVSGLDSKPSTSSNTGSIGASSGATSSTQTLRGVVSGKGDYAFHNLGASVPGDAWTLTGATFGMTGTVVAAFFDAEDNLLMRKLVSPGGSLEHIVREATNPLQVAVMPYGSGAVTYDLTARRTPNSTIPAPNRQVVLLNFAGGQGVKIHTRGAVSFGAFDAGRIDPRFDGRTAELKSLILDAMREDYADFQVDFYTSDDSIAPSGAYSTIHFGAGVDGLLGLADSVDNYNADPSQAAIVYTNSFAIYQTMQMDLEAMAMMIANVASHELGHLLGLYHTADPDDVMDTTASAWELTKDQAFGRAVLEPSVFATGYEDSPMLLEHGVGRNLLEAKVAMRAAADQPVMLLRDEFRGVRRWTEVELQTGCGTCLHLDDH